MKPWTWKEIAALDADGKAKFIADYGDRGKAAIVLAVNGYACCDPRKGSAIWHCDQCPLDRDSKWRIGLPGSCVNRANHTYSRMVAELGLMPEEEVPR